MTMFKTVSPVRLIQLITLIFFLVLSSASDARADKGRFLTGWRPIGADLEEAEMELRGSGLFSSYIKLYRTSLRSLRVGVIRAEEFGLRRATVKQLCQEAKAVLCINASFFDERWKPLGLVLSRGNMFHPLQLGGGTLTGVLQVRKGRVEVVHRDSFNPYEVSEAFQGGPRLVSGGQRVGGIRDTSLARRSVLCVDGSKRMVFAVVSSTLLGIKLQNLQELLTNREVGCVEALNLDGGGSSQLFLNSSIGLGGPGLELSIFGGDQVPVALALFPRFKW